MSVPPYVCGAVGLHLFAVCSGSRREKGSHICGGIVVALAGLIIMLTATSSSSKHAGTCVVLFGS